MTIPQEEVPKHITLFHYISESKKSSINKAASQLASASGVAAEAATAVNLTASGLPGALPGAAKVATYSSWATSILKSVGHFATPVVRLTEHQGTVGK